MTAMRSSGSPTKRKRGLLQLNNSSALPSDQTQSVLKRRRLSPYGPSKTAPKGLQALKHALGGVFGYGRIDEQEQPRGALESDEILERENSGSEETEEAQTSAAVDDLVEDELNDTRADNADTMVQFKKPSSTQANLQRRKMRSKNGDHPSSRIPDAGVYDDELGENGDEIAVEDGDAEGSPSGSRLSRARHSTDSAIREGSVISTANSSINGDAATESAGRASRRERKKPRRFSNEMLESVKQDPKSILTPTKNKLKRPKKNVAFQVGEVDDLDLGFRDLPSSEVKPKPSQQIRGRKATPGKKATVGVNLNDVINDEIEATEHTPIPKRKPGRPRKDSIIPKSKPKRARLEEEEEEEDDEDANVFCAVCDGGESEEPNEILMCDNCDLAVHQQCYQIPQIPEDDWYCRDCRPEADDGIVAMDIEAVPEPILDLGALSTSGPDIDGIDYHLQIMQRLLLEKLTGRRRLKLHGLKDEYNKVHQLVEQTILAGEGNSMLVIGSRGCGKTTLVESVLDNLSMEHRHNFHIVRLNGFTHTDDKLALREIWRQLGREMDVEDELTSKASSFADTLASLLALLSHPSEISEDNDGQTAKSVIFVLDEFDLFTTHPRQTLLYNLFDIAQSRKAPIAILGVTTKIDVVESLEKRVKSRFSHRYVHLPLPKSLSVYWDICKAGISVDLAEIVEQGFDPGLAGQDEFLSYWNSMLDTLHNQDALFANHLQAQFYRSKSVSSFLTTCILPIASLTPSSLPLTGRSFVNSATNLSAPDSKLHLLQSLAELDLAMLIAAARLDIILDTDTCNFAMAYDEYSNLTSKHKIHASSTGALALGSSAKVWGREVAMGSWERLIDCELLIPAGLGGTGVVGREVGREGKMWRVDVGLEEIPGSVVGLTSIMSKWCREI